MALWGLVRVRDALGWHDSASTRWLSFPVVLLLFALVMVAQITEVFVLNFVPRGMGLAPVSLTPSLTAGVPGIGVDLTYAEFGGLCAYVGCNVTNSWWDTSYRLMEASLGSIPAATVSVSAPRIAVNKTGSIITSYLNVPLGTASTADSGTDGLVAATEALSLSSIPVAIKSADPVFANARIFVPITDALTRIVFNDTMLMQQITWPVAGTASNGSASTALWRAEVMLQLKTAYKVQASTGSRGYLERNLTWASVVFASENQLNETQAVDGGGTTVGVYGEYICLTGHIGSGMSAGVLVMPGMQGGGLLYIGIGYNATAVQHPHMYLSHALVWAQVSRCRAYGTPTASGAFRWWLAACPDSSGACGDAVYQGMLDADVQQPTGIISFEATVLNARACEGRCKSGSGGATSDSGASVSWYVPHELTVAWVRQGQVLQLESGQAWPGVCQRNGLCSGLVVPLWLLGGVVVLLAAALVAFAMVEDLGDVVLHGLLQTTGPYGAGLSSGEGALRADTLCYLQTGQRQAYVGVRARDTLYERARFMADPGERLERGRDGVRVSSIRAGRRLARAHEMELE
nr:hypothetical protein HK105_000797 [Polyrhizophydium stewartii]